MNTYDPYTVPRKGFTLAQWFLLIFVICALALVAAHALVAAQEKAEDVLGRTHARMMTVHADS